MRIRLPVLPVCLAALMLAGCVTINIYFPASAAEKAADRIIDEIWQMRGTPKPAEKAEPARPAEPAKESRP